MIEAPMAELGVKLLPTDGFLPIKIQGAHKRG